MSEYGDPISPEQIELAVEKVLEMRRAVRGPLFDDQVRAAVAQAICGCVLAIEDDLEGHLSGTHAGVLDEVRRQVELRLGEAARSLDDEIDDAAEESMPTSAPGMDLGPVRRSR